MGALRILIRVGFAGLKPNTHQYKKNRIVDEKGAVKPIFYVFYQDNLMSVAIKIGTNLFDAALPSFLSYYGKPTSHVDKAIRNPYGKVTRKHFPTHCVNLMYCVKPTIAPVIFGSQGFLVLSNFTFHNKHAIKDK